MSIPSFMRSRLFLALVALAAALVIATACNGDGGGTETPSATETPSVTETPTGGGTTAEIKMIPGTAFDRAQLTIAAGTDVTVTADNTDGTHSFAVYNSQEEASGGAESLGETEVCTAPCTETVTLNLAAGEYFFRCEVHQTVMTGTLIAQ